MFFGEPEFETSDLLRTDADGRGVITAVELAGLQDRPQLFCTFLMWLLADLFEELPEVGDVDKPKLVFFFDEAHLLFNGASKAFLDVGHPDRAADPVQGRRASSSSPRTRSDVPDDVLGQLGNRVQHALRAFTPDDAAALAKAVKTYPKTDDYDLSADLQQLGTGEAVVTVLSERGAPTPVAWTRHARAALADGPDRPGRPAAGRRGVAAAGRSTAQTVDRESAYERLAARLAPPPAPPASPDRRPPARAPTKTAPRPRQASAGQEAGHRASNRCSSRRRSSPSPARRRPCSAARSPAGCSAPASAERRLRRLRPVSRSAAATFGGTSS